jgi:hypothetical protein
MRQSERYLAEGAHPRVLVEVCARMRCCFGLMMMLIVCGFGLNGVDYDVCAETMI